MSDDDPLNLDYRTLDNLMRRQRHTLSNTERVLRDEIERLRATIRGLAAGDWEDADE